MAKKIETHTLKLPANFDGAKHAKILEKWVVDTLGEGWVVEHMNTGDNSVTASRQTTITEMVDVGTNADTKDIGLRRDTKPADGDKIAAKLESDYPGYRLTRFEPFLGVASLQRMADSTVRARGAIAQVLGVKPWEVQIKTRSDGGFDIELPGNKYSSSKHDEKLQATVETDIGREGWYIQTNPQKLTASIIPSDPPTFPSAIGYPLAGLRKTPRDLLPFGMKLPAPGQATGAVASIDWVSQAFAMVAGTPGAGKSVTLNALIAGALASGSELVVCDLPEKAVDFNWVKPFVRDSGWGCDSLAGAVTALALVYEEGQRRAEVLGASGHTNWLDMPAGQQFKPVLIIVDEVSGLLVADKIPAGIPKDHPLAMEVAEENLLKAALSSYITKIISQQRFVGMRMVLSTQITNNNTGIGPSLKGKIGHKILQGQNPSKSQRTQSFNDETAVPNVPSNIRADAKVAKGTGAAELEGSEPFIYKAYFATTAAYKEALSELHIPTTSRPSPTSAQIDKFAPRLDSDDDGPRPKSRYDNGGFGESSERDEPRLRGAAAAGHELKVQEQAAKRAAAASE
ncbi:FtsK/SpoIIIE domain-containing protein [Glaciihabitans sp. INWT7]|uniref:FtsK/SpoIIIE domain-containing protein n=1 Tax=Glaciihabitans sp. INWT7 TaxID=2596912 RepID=UPI00162625C1|nr:FtsK/SpoIIIE domain-containing protein [Glaciihabitans sp. INWT7]